MKNDKKPIYESPVIIPLGELAKGSGACEVGSLHTEDPGAPPGYGPFDCISGGEPRNPGGQVQTCAAGGNAK